MAIQGDILTVTENAFKGFISSSIGLQLNDKGYDVLAGGYGVLTATENSSGIICSCESATEIEPQKAGTRLKLGAHHEVDVVVEIRGNIQREAISSSYGNHLDVVGLVHELFATGSLEQHLTNATNNYNCVFVQSDAPSIVKGFMANSQGTNTHWVLNKNFKVRCGLRP